MKKLSLVLFAILVATTAHAQTEFKNPPELSKPTGYTHVVATHGSKLIFISGETGLNAKGELASGFDAQVKQAFANLKIALAAAGATTDNIVKLNYYVVGLNQEKLLALRSGREPFINKEHPPASTLVGVQVLFREDALIEIEAEAVLP